MLHQIGVGALGPVFRTYEPDRDRLVAVKVFRLDITPEQSRSLADELARAAEASLFHPSIVEPVAAGLERTLAYRAEEYVAAESLDVAMRHYAPATVDKVLPFVTQLAGAIDFARAAGFGHGALHPRDIFITPDEARATGFGVVDALDRVGLRSPVRRPYSPPERVAGEPWNTPADVFSLAVIAFELLTGRRPSGAGDEMGSLSGATLGAAEDRVRAVLARATHETPAERYQTAVAFASALEGAWRGEAEPERVDPFGGLRVDGEPGRTVEGPPLVLELTGETAPEERLREVVTKPARKRDSRKRVLEEAILAPSHGPLIDAIVPEPTVADSSVPENVASSKPSDLAAAVVVDKDTVEQAADTISHVAAELPLTRDGRDRIFAVDEFRAREVTGPAAGRGRPRPQPRIAVPSVPSRDLAERDVPDVPLFAGIAPSDELLADRPPVAMLPLALTLILGLLVGFAGGYVVGGRQVPASEPTATQATAEKPGTAPAPGTTGQAPGREWSEQAVTLPATAQPPTTAPAVPPDAPPPVASTGTAPAPTPAEARRVGRIVVRSTPAGASVTVNDTWSGRTPLTLDDLTFRSYVVRVVHPGYEVAREAFTLSPANASKTMSIQLRRLPAAARQKPPAAAATAPRPPQGNATGELFIDSRPRNARVLIDGKERGTTPLRIPAMSLGVHVVRLELADHQPWTTNTQVIAGETARVTGSLERIR